MEPIRPLLWWVLPCSVALSGSDQPSARGARIPGPLDPNSQTGFRLVVAWLHAARWQGMGGSSPSRDGCGLPLLELHDYAVLYSGTIGSAGAVHYRISCTALCLAGTKEIWINAVSSPMDCEQFPYPQSNFALSRVAWLDPPFSPSDPSSKAEEINPCSDKIQALLVHLTLHRPKHLLATNSCARLGCTAWPHVKLPSLT